MKLLYLFLCSFLLTVGVYAQQAGDTPEKAAPVPDAKTFKSTQTAVIGGRNYTFQTEVGTHLLRDQDDKPIALFGFTYYKQAGGKDRPIVFAFNGGPLSASFWLHFGILGPKRVVVNDPGYTGPAPYQVVNNEYSILDKADLVMIDPVGVGFSRPVGKSEFKDFWGVDQDIRSIGSFIEQFLIREGRMNHPRFLLGESYGTFRNAGLVKWLQDRGIAMNGVIMVSAVFELQHLLFGPGDDTAYLIHFPTYAATAWYHNRLPSKNPDLEAFLSEVRRFTEQEYAPALLQGDRLSAAEKQAMAGRLAAYSGLSANFWLKANLRVTNQEYFQELLRDAGETVGRLDSRFTGVNEDLLGQYAQTDPQSDAISAPYIAAFKDYLYSDLGVDRNMTYVTSTGLRDGFQWDWKHQGNLAWNAQVAVSTLPDMTSAMNRNPNLKILILNGYYDLATVFYGVEHSISHMGLKPELQGNIIMKYYEAGHMMYTHPPSMAQFKADVGAFIDEQ
ncbi:carboxypeptidase [Robiginitalea sp. M366]|uniref:S10 family peptidase n=1 Tax=Robiginitalea aestuariiviva TaxID=3036903 RepID=UPI00240E9972|nr:carboxypeptidase [Robiginitalea aestuariiviva]MDG1573439.1 carboxypeptidase [Robiginitalea aestuariiviva]